MKKLIIVAALLAIAALAACGSTTYSGPTPTQTGAAAQSTATLPTATPTQSTITTGSVGQTATVGVWKVTLTKVTKTAGGEFDSGQLATGELFLVIHVAVTNTSDQSQTIFSGLFTVRDAAGNSEKFGYVSTAQQEPNGSVLPGHPFQGDLTYIVPTKVQTYLLSFRPGFIDSTEADWTFRV